MKKKDLTFTGETFFLTPAEWGETYFITDMDDAIETMQESFDDVTIPSQMDKIEIATDSDGQFYAVNTEAELYRKCQNPVEVIDGLGEIYGKSEMFEV